MPAPDDGGPDLRERAASAVLPVLQGVRRVPTPLVAGLVGLLLLGALVVGSWPGGVLLGGLVVALAGLTWLVWPRLSTGDRVLRVVVLAVLAAVAVHRVISLT